MNIKNKKKQNKNLAFDIFLVRIGTRSFRCNYIARWLFMMKMMICMLIFSVCECPLLLVEFKRLFCSHVLLKEREREKEMYLKPRPSFLCSCWASCSEFIIQTNYFLLKKSEVISFKFLMSKFLWNFLMKVFFLFISDCAWWIIFNNSL